MLSSLYFYIAALPIILPVWEKGPMPKEYLKYDNIGFKAESAKTKLQIEGLKFKDPIFKMEVLRRLSLLETEEAAQIMYDFLKSETEPTLRAATLSYLYFSPTMSKNLSLVEGLINNQTDEGIAAAKLYCKFKDAKVNKVTKLLKGTSTRNKVTLVNALKENNKLNPNQWLKVLNEDKSQSFQAAVLAAIASKPSSDNSFALVKKLLESDNALQKTAIASSLLASEKNSTLYITMSQDKHATVRRAAAKGMGSVVKTSFEDKLIALSKDKDAEVRKEASKSLRNYP